ncbi:MAG: hypothetical protein IBV52_08535 [Candidatus Bathyarchaeota archaeon]
MSKKAVSSVFQAEPVLKQDQFKLTRFDYIAAPLLAFGVGLWVFSHIWTAINWDDLLYMSLSQHTVPQAWILNRYGHIYLQKFFFWIAGDAINGGRVFWCFLFSGTCVLTYWCARILAGKKGYIIGVIAVLFLGMQHVFGKDPGCSLPDFTIMFLVVLATFVYLAFLNRRSKYRHLLIVLLGLIFFWAVKSKESGICLAVLFFGLGEDETGVRNIKLFVKDIGWVLVGMLAGCALLMLLDLSFMGDALFSIRPSNIKMMLGGNIHSPSARANVERISMSWYTFLTTRPIFVPFLLYLLVGRRSPIRDFSIREKMPWLFPLVLIVFIWWVRCAFYIIPRYFTPAIPIVSIWAAQFFRFELRGAPLSWKGGPRIPRLAAGIFLVLVSFIIGLMFLPKIPGLVEYYKLDGPVMGFHNLKYNKLDSEQVFYILVIIPLVVTVLLIVGTMSKKRGLAALFFSSVCLFVLVFPALGHNITLLKQRTVAQKSEWRFEPYRVFEDELQFEKGARILVSKEMHTRSWMLGRNAKAHCHMFNIFYNQNFDYEQFVDGSWEDILKGDYAYAFLTVLDWKGISEKHNVAHLLRDYELKTDERAVYRTRSGPMQLILLKRRSAYPALDLQERTDENFD